MPAQNLSQPPLLNERHDKTVSWRVWQEDGILVKSFHIHRWTSVFNRRWAREHRGLKRLNHHGLPSPKTYGYHSPQKDTVIYRREYLPGSPVKELSQDNTRQLSAYMARVHAAAVTNGDVSYDNLLMTDQGELMLIDYGRSRTFCYRGPLFFFNAGKELARIRRRLFPENDAMWTLFVEAYLAESRLGSWAQALTDWSMRRWSGRWGLDPADATVLRSAPSPDTRQASNDKS